MYTVRESLQSLQARGIDGRHVAQSENNDGLKIGQTGNNHVEFVGSAEQKRAVNPEDADVRRNVFVLQDVGVSFLNVLVGHFGHRGRLSHLSNEHQRGQNHAGFYHDREIREDGQQKRHQPRANLEQR